MSKELIEYIRDDLNEVKADVKLLLAAKNQQLGGVIATSTIISIIFGVISLFVSRGAP